MVSTIPSPLAFPVVVPDDIPSPPLLQQQQPPAKSQTPRIPCEEKPPWHQRTAPSPPAIATATATAIYTCRARRASTRLAVSAAVGLSKEGRSGLDGGVGAVPIPSLFLFGISCGSGELGFVVLWFRG